jgi:hypothetical protein
MLGYIDAYISIFGKLTCKFEELSIVEDDQEVVVYAKKKLECIRDNIDVPESVVATSEINEEAPPEGSTASKIFLSNIACDDSACLTDNCGPITCDLSDLPGKCSINKYAHMCGIFKKNKKNLVKSINYLRSIFQMLNMLDNIFLELQNEYFQTTNNYNLYNRNGTVKVKDVEYTTKILNVINSQVDTIIKIDDSPLYSASTPHKSIRIYLGSSKYYTICQLDTFRIRKIEHEGANFLVVDIGEREFRIQYLKDSFTIEYVLDVLDFNFKSATQILECIKSNQELIKYWLIVVKKIYYNSNV